MAVCPIDGTKIGIFGGFPVKDGEICSVCAEKVGFIKGDVKSETAAYSYQIDEIKQLIDESKQFDPNHAKETREETIKKSHDNLNENPMDKDYLKKLFAKYGLDNLDESTTNAVKNAMGNMSAFGFARVSSTLTNLQDRYQITLNQTQIEQNWILIKQQDETNKLLRQLIDKQ